MLLKLVIKNFAGYIFFDIAKKNNLKFYFVKKVCVMRISFQKKQDNFYNHLSFNG